MKKTLSIILSLCFILSMLTLSASAKKPDITFEPAYDEVYDFTYRDNSISLMSEGANLPASFDARDKGWVTPLKSQGSTGSCWAFSIISNFESYNISQGIDGADADYSEAHLVWSAETKTTNKNDPTYGDGKVSTNPYDDGGSYNSAIGALAKWSGIADEKTFPMSENRTLFNESDRYNSGSGYVIKSAEHLMDSNSVKEWIMEYGSVTVDFYCATDYMGVNVDGETNVAFWNYEELTANHKVSIIGWHDRFPMTQVFDYTEDGQESLMPPANGAWLCKDSNDFYCWISYYDPTICNATAYTSQPSSLYRTNYTYNGTGYVESAQVQGSVSAANVFTAKEHEILSAVSTHTLTPNQTVNVSIYKNLNSNYTNPSQGSLVSNHTVTLSNAGYHTIDLPQDIALTPNEKFSVVIELLPVNGYTEFPVERQSSDANALGFYYASKTKQSYLDIADTGWYTSEAYGLCNVFVQAFTSCNHQINKTKSDPTANKDGYIRSSCTQCMEVFEDETLPAYGFNPVNGAVIDKENKTIYGLAAGIKSLDKYTDIILDGYHWEYEPTKFGFGTGTKAIMKKGNTIIDEYTILIFGDVNGDGWYNGDDAFLTNMIVSGMLTEEGLGSVRYAAADCNHDGLINEADTELLNNAGLKMNDIDQNVSESELLTQTAYLEYSSLVSQSFKPEDDNAEIPNEALPDNPIQPEGPAQEIPSFGFSLLDLIMSIIRLISALFGKLISA